MNNEIKTLLERLNIDQRFFSEVENASIEKVLVYDPSYNEEHLFHGITSLHSAL